MIGRLSLFAGSIALVTPLALAQASTWVPDKAHSEVTFSILHMSLANVRRHFGNIGGTIVVNDADITKSTVNVTQSELNDHVHRILRTIFASGLFDNPVISKVPDVEHGLIVAQRIAEKSIVLLKNDRDALPLNPSLVRSIVVIGGHADKGVLTGGGCAQVDSPGGSPVSQRPFSDSMGFFRREQWLPSAPLKALESQFSQGTVSFLEGDNLDEAAHAAKSADVAIVFAHQWEAEEADLESLNLPDTQNKLIEAIAAPNPGTIVVLETGSPVTMPCIDKVAGVIEAWYPRIRGAEALANIIAGKVNPTGKLAVTFPKDDGDLPHPKIVVPPPESQRRRRSAGTDPAADMAELAKGLPPCQVYYDEKLKVGYKWCDAEQKPVLFPFGFGLSYTTYRYSNLIVQPGQSTSVVFSVTNSGKCAGTEIAEEYAGLLESANEPPKRLVGWTRIELAPGESKQVTVPIEIDRLMVYDEAADAWKLVNRSYTFLVGASSQDLPLKQTQTLP